MTEFAKNNLWLIPILPLAAAVLIGLFGRKMKPIAHIPAWLAMAGALVIALTLLFSFKAPVSTEIEESKPVGEVRNIESSERSTVVEAHHEVKTPESYQTNYFTWFSVGKITESKYQFSVPVGIFYDHLTAIYLSFITGVGFLIFIYGAGT